MDNKPKYEAFHATDRVQKDGEEKGGFFTKIGAAWEHKDGNGYTVAFDMVPLNGRIVLREREEKEEETASENQEALPLPAE